MLHFSPLLEILYRTQRNTWPAVRSSEVGPSGGEKEGGKQGWREGEGGKEGGRQGNAEESGRKGNRGPEMRIKKKRKKNPNKQEKNISKRKKKKEIWNIFRENSKGNIKAFYLKINKYNRVFKKIKLKKDVETKWKTINYFIFLLLSGFVNVHICNVCVCVCVFK